MASWDLSVSPPVRMSISHHFLEVLKRDVGVELCAGDRRMTKDRLNMAQIRMVTQHLRSHRVAEGVRRDCLADTPLPFAALATIWPTVRTARRLPLRTLTNSAFSSSLRASHGRTALRYASVKWRAYSPTGTTLPFLDLLVTITSSCRSKLKAAVIRSSMPRPVPGCGESGFTLPPTLRARDRARVPRRRPSRHPGAP